MSHPAVLARAACTANEERGRSDISSFLRAWWLNPWRVGALAPSGERLASLMTMEISIGCSPVIELGPGTGVFTRALKVKGIPEEQLVLVEFAEDFARLLSDRFPAARIHCMDAARLKNLSFHGGAGAVVSGLPLLSMSPKKVIAILEGAFGHLRSGGAFYQFTYGPSCPVPRAILDRLGLKAVRLGLTFANLPPAAVYRICRRARRPEP